MSFKKEQQAIQDKIQEEIRRVKLPRDKQVIGVVEQRLGGSRMKVRCLDGKNRICRIPGRLRKSLWVREGDHILVEPWALGGEDKGDVIFKYRPSQTAWLKRSGHLKSLDVDEF